jgi:pimeloyl-ACP methyl ester carboxylesterase
MRFEPATLSLRKLPLIFGLLLSAINPAWSAEVPSSAEMKQTLIDGSTFFYQEQGTGSPVVFVHGCCTDLRAWEGQRDAIAKRDRFIALNLRYHGTGSWAGEGPNYSIQTHVSDVASFIKGLNLGPVDLVGWSYSGPIVLSVALQYPEIVRSLTVYEPTAGAYISDPASVKSAGEDRQAALGPAVAASKAGDLAAVARSVPAGVNNQPDLFTSLPPQVQSMFLDNARTVALLIGSPPPPPLTCAQLSQIKVPTLISRGEATRAVFQISTEALAKCIPDSKFVMVPGARHLGMILQPEAFNEMLVQFLKR